MITRININPKLIKEDITFKGSCTKSEIGTSRYFSSETQLCNITTVPKDEWKHTTPDGVTSGAKLRTIDIRGEVCELEIVTRHNTEGFVICSMMNPQAELVYCNDVLVGIVVTEK